MDSVLKNVMDKLPGWFFQIAGIILLIAIVIFLWFILFGTKQLSRVFSSILKRDDKIEKLHDELLNEKERSGRFEDTSLQLGAAVRNLRPIIASLNKLRKEESVSTIIQEVDQLIQRCLDTLASDLKTKAGGLHRCGLWIKQDDYLRLVNASSGFPKNYAGSRQLNINRSVAGRCVRKMQIINLDDVTTDSDWEDNPDSKRLYTSLICIPVGDWIVLTIDGYQPMGEYAQLLGELYANLFEGIINEHMRAISNLSENITQDEVSVGS
jgi:hypothetical protein